MIDQYLKHFTGVDWDDLRQVTDRTQAPLAALANDPDALAELFARLENNSEFLDLSEHLTWCDKIVLHDDPRADAGFRLRLHFFLPGYSDRPHSHRWSFSTYLLKGGYEHTLYGSDVEFERAAAPVIQPTMIRLEQAGTSYSLHHSSMHSFSAEPCTVSLVVRGPAVKDRSIQFDPAQNKTTWKYGTKDESSSTQVEARLDRERLAQVIRELRGFGLVT